MAASPEQEMQIKQLEADLKNAQNRVSQLARMLENNKIKAPFDGVVTLSKDLPIQEGDAGNARFVRLSDPPVRWLSPCRSMRSSSPPYQGRR